MEQSYKNVGYFFIIILAIVIWGFFRTYFGLFPSFNGITTVQHFHGIMMLAWFAMLIIQPFLIRYKKMELHRAIGKFSYVLVPFILWSIFLVMRGGYLRMAPVIPHEQNVGGLALNLPDIFAFGALYILAIVNKKNTAYHMRYIIGTSLLLIGPGIGRAFIIYGGMAFPTAIQYTMALTEAVCGTLIIYDIVKKQPYKPYIITMLILIAMHLCWQFQMAGWWQVFAGRFATLFF